MEAAEEVAAAAGPLARTPSAGAPAHIRRSAAARSRLLWRSIVPTSAGHRRCTVVGTLPLSSVSARQARWASRCVTCCGFAHVLALAQVLVSFAVIRAISAPKLRIRHEAARLQQMLAHLFVHKVPCWHLRVTRGQNGFSIMRDTWALCRWHCFVDQVGISSTRANSPTICERKRRQNDDEESNCTSQARRCEALAVDVERARVRDGISMTRRKVFTTHVARSSPQHRN